MPFSPPPRPRNGKRKRNSIPSSEPPAKRERPSPNSQLLDPAEGPEDVPETIHPPLPNSLSKLHPNQRPTIHDLTVISSSKINLKVTQLLKLLYPDVEREVHATQHITAAKPTEQNNNGTIVRLSAKSNVASKAISVAEIIKREIRSRRAKARDDPTKQQEMPQLFQYTQLHGVRLPPKQQQQNDKSKGKPHPANVANGAIHEAETAQPALDSNSGTTNAPAEPMAKTTSDSPIEPTESSLPDAPRDITVQPKPTKLLIVKSAKGKKTHTDADGYLVTRDITSADEDESDANSDVGADLEAHQDGTEEAMRLGTGAEIEAEDDTDTSLVTIPGAISTGQTDAAAPIRPQTHQTAPADSPNTHRNDVQDALEDDPEAEDEDDDAAFTTLVHPEVRAKDRERLALIESLSNSNTAKQRRKDERPTSVLTIYLATRRLNGLAEEFGEEEVK